MDKIILIGYGGHAESVADSIRQLKKYEIIGYTDKTPIDKIFDYPYSLLIPFQILVTSMKCFEYTGYSSVYHSNFPDTSQMQLTKFLRKIF